MNKLVSIIIPTTPKEEHHLKQCLLSIQASTYKNYEIIVVNEGLERSAQRNIGIDRAKGDYLLFLDSDQYISPYLIENCVWRIHLAPGGLYIPEVIVTPGLFGMLRNWERAFYTSTPIDVVRFVHARNCPKFDLTMSGPEDSDWDRRQVGNKLTSREPLYHNDGVSLISYCRKKAYYTKSMKRYLEKWPNDKCVNFWWRCFGVFFEKGKWKRVLRRPDLFVLLMGLILIRGAIYICGK